MPIMKPEIQAALREVGLSKESKGTVSEVLNDVDLSVAEGARILSDIAYNSENVGERRRAVETSFKLHGILNDQPAQQPNITIIISDPHAPTGVNPILLPREVTTKRSIQ